MKKPFTHNKYLPVALALAAFAVAGAAPAFAQSSDTWSAGISTRNIRPYVQSPSTKDNGYSAYAQVPALAPSYSALAPSWTRGSIRHWDPTIRALRVS